MFIKLSKAAIRALIVSGTLFGLMVLSPSAVAGGAFSIVPEKNPNLPQGTLIPQQRLQKIEKQMTEFMQSIDQENQQQPDERAFRRTVN